ncbi:MAG: sensor histidine kinase [Flavobacteriales bacterium]|jgi:two-component system phosphate regulon sensor histidine kinase PhoR|tara:strand:+ start:5331 stop:6362 length:1032 start_codon:yes stop_codon:yes gene_type:complete
MSSFNKIKFRPFLFSILLSLIITSSVYFFLILYFENYIGFFILFALTLLISFVFITLYLKFFVSKKVKDILEQLIPEQKISGQTLISTNMEDLVEQLKNYSKESQTEMKSMQEKENFRRNFIGNLAHELKTPLFTSQSYLLTLIDGALKDENVNLKYLKIAEKAIERLIFIVKDLDLITKLESDDLKIESTDFNIISIVNNVFEMLEIQASKKNISLILENKTKQINVFADQEKIHQVLTNLIENSIKYGKVDGTTELSIEKIIDNKLIIRITDNGNGIKKEHFERLFERFYRIENSGNRNTGGSGLGLAIVKHIIDAHNEKIYVESDFGVGSEFSFSLEKSN